MSMDDQGTKCRRKIAENYNRLSRVYERYRRHTDNRQTEWRQHIANVNEFTFAKNRVQSWRNFLTSERVSVFWRQCDTLHTVGFVDDVMFYSKAYEGMSVSGSLRRERKAELQRSASPVSALPPAD